MVYLNIFIFLLVKITFPFIKMVKLTWKEVFQNVCILKVYLQLYD